MAKILVVRMRDQAMAFGFTVPHAPASEGFLLEAPSTEALKTELQSADGPSLEPLPKRMGALRGLDPLQQVAWAREVFHPSPLRSDKFSKNDISC